MKELSKKFRKRLYNEVFTFTQLKRVGDLAIYEQLGDESLVHYEVVKIQLERPDKTRLNRSTARDLPDYEEIHEVYPITSKWGELGWTYTAYEDAVKKMEVLTA